MAERGCGRGGGHGGEERREQRGQGVLCIVEPRGNHSR